jgi:hypothetical protein
MPESDNKLLIRIDERQKQMSNDIADIKKNLECTVRDDDEYKDLKKKIYTMWDERNRVIGWLLACGIVGGTTGALVKQLVSSVLAK